VKPTSLATWLSILVLGGAQAQNTAIPSPPPPTAAPAVTPATPATNQPAAVAPRPVTAPATNRIAVPRTFPSGRTAVAPTAPTAQPAARPGVTPTAPGGARPGVPNVAGQAANAASTADQEANDAALAAAKAATTAEEAVDAVKFRNMPLEQVLDFYARLTGRTVLRGAGLNLTLPITYTPEIPLSLEETIQALDTVFALNQITTIPTGDNFTVVVPSQQALQQGAKFSAASPGDYSEASQFVNHIVQIKHIDPKEAAELVKVFASAQGANGVVALESTKTLILRDFAINVKRMLEVLERVDVEVADEYVLEVIPIRYGKVEDIYQTLQSVISGSGGGGGGGLGGGGGGFNQGGFNQGGFNQGGFNQGGFNQRNRGGLNNRSGGLNGGMNNRGGNFFPNQVNPPVRMTTPATGSGQTFQGRLNAAGRGQGQGGLGTMGELSQNSAITPDLRSNKLIVYGRKKDIEKIKEVVEKVDTLLAQVLIEAIIMEVNLGANSQFGVTAGQRPKSFNGDPNVVGGGMINNGGNRLGTGNAFLGGLASSASNFPSSSGLNYFLQLGNNWDLAINALATDSRANVIQRPRVLTSHATPGSFQVGSEVPFITGSFNGGFGNSSQIDRQFVGVGLDVIPFITPDDLVVMEINQTIDQLGAPVQIDNNSIPTTQTRSASSTVTVRNKEAILLGGYITSNSTRSREGVPGLSAIPILGNLFSSRSRNSGRTELMVLMRPTILPTPGDAAEMADLERERLPGVRVAEREFEQAEQVENEKADRKMKDSEKKKRKF
jgi:general secretion pathway protein D